MTNKIKDILFRYLLLLLLPLNNLYLFYLILTPLTLYPIYFILDIFFHVSLFNSTISIFELGLNVDLINSCIAGSAYYFLLILNLSIPNIKIRSRIYMILYSFSLLLLANITRILILVILFRNSFFDLTHQLFWYVFSTIFVIFIWFSEVKLFKIKDLPIITDIKYLSKLTK